MIYTEEEADKVIKQHGFDPGRKKNWKKRGIIPKSYLPGRGITKEKEKEYNARHYEKNKKEHNKKSYEIRKKKLKTDPGYREKVNAYFREWEQKNREKRSARKKKDISEKDIIQPSSIEKAKHMIYTDEKADEIIQQHGLSPTTKKVWKSRGKIPAMYTTGRIKGKPLTNEADQQTAKNIIRVLKSGLLHRRSVCRLAEVQDYIINDIINSQESVFTEYDLTRLKKAINHIRIEAKAIQTMLLKKTKRSILSDKEAKQITDFITRKEIVSLALFKHNRPLMGRYLASQRGITFPSETIEEFKVHLTDFLVQTAI